MDNSLKFKNLREKYKDFIYDSYEIKEDKGSIILKYKFEVPNLTKFEPEIKILKKELKLKKVEEDTVKNMVFHIGLIELISYWKCVCSPNVIIKCGFLDEYQKEWFKKLYFNGLGELFFKNEIKTNIKDFMNITCLEKSSNINTIKEAEIDSLKDKQQEKNNRLPNTNRRRKRFLRNIRNTKI